MHKRAFEDLNAGDTFDLGSRQVSQEDIIAFAREFDPQPFHVDPELAKDSMFGGLIASGWHTAAMFMRLLVDGLLNGTESMGSPGLDELRWLKPVRPGDTLRARYTLLDARPSASRPEVGIVRGRGELLNQHDELVMTLTSVGFFRRRPSAST